MRGKYTHIDKDTLIKTYEDNNRSMRAAAKVLGTSEKTIMRRMKEYGYEWDPKPFYKCNENFFDELNEKSLYWLGFLATDGNVYKHNYTYNICFKLSAKDRNHLQKFKDDICSESPIHDIITKPKNNDNFKKKEYPGITLNISSEKIFNRLAQFNIVPAKTHIYRFPEQLKNHPDVRHFIRGCIDGDGWWRTHKNNGKDYITDIRVGMCGTPEFVKEIFDLIKEKCSINSGSYYIRKVGKTADFEFCAKNDVNIVFNYLYSNSLLYLDRKLKIAQMIKEF
jgi:uncharacterized protein (DUF736 family)